MTDGGPKTPLHAGTRSGESRAFDLREPRELGAGTQRPQGRRSLWPRAFVEMGQRALRPANMFDSIPAPVVEHRDTRHMPEEAGRGGAPGSRT